MIISTVICAIFWQLGETNSKSNTYPSHSPNTHVTNERKSSFQPRQIIFSSHFEAPFTVDFAIPPVISERSELSLLKELKEPGDSMDYKGFTIIKLDAEYHSEEEPRYIEAWEATVAQYFTDSELPPEFFHEYKNIKSKSFESYEKVRKERIQPIESEIQEVFGFDAAIALNDEIKALLQTSWKSYDSSLRGLLGDARYEDFDSFRIHHRLIAIDRNENPGLIQ